MDDNYLRDLDDDGIYAPSIKSHSLKKIRLHNYYVSVFTNSMKGSWPQRAYLGLYSGAGRAIVEGTDEIVETTATSSLRLQHPFTHYIFVDNNSLCLSALKARVNQIPGDYEVTYIEEDVRASVPKIIQAMPSYSREHGLLSFCFIDPFSADLDFHVIKELGTRYRMDFLILLMLGRDIRMNFKRYLNDPNDTRIAALIDDPNWREDWNRNGRFLIRFLLKKFNEAMIRIGYKAMEPAEAAPVTVKGLGVYLYSLVLYSKRELGKKFWKATRKGTDSQLSLDL
jgi:three-Cys-motif partner protein